ncbi:hypothetical protein QA860_12030 [Streptomyces stelliscabiei]|uniref:hypothetical protein n=1 Tax=Streptomyces stelliscabiei TaxID=146820 RepID=UPI002FF249D5
MLDLIEDVMDDDFTLTEAIDGFCHHAVDLLNIPAEYGILVEVEVEAAAQIVQAAGLPAGSLFGPSIAQGLAHIETRPIDDQQHLVRVAARRYASTMPSRRRTRIRQVPAAPLVQPPRPTR